jgi:hypothetical protein
MLTRYYKWMFVESFSGPTNSAFALLQPLEEICEQAGEGYTLRPVISVTQIARPIFKRRYFVAREDGKMSLVEHDVRLDSRTRSTTVLNRQGEEHYALLKALHCFYSREEDYRVRCPEIAAPFIIVENH